MPSASASADLDADLVANGDHRESRAVGAPVRAERGGTGRPLAPAEHVGADDEVAIRVDRGARPDEPVPPTRRSRWPGPAGPGGMGVPRQGVEDQDARCSVPRSSVPHVS